MNRSVPYSVFAVLLTTACATAQLVNGGFETGDLSGWTVFNDTNGTTGPVSVVPFDTAGTGVASNSAQFEVGSTVVVYFGVGNGGGISQTVSLAAGDLTIFLNIAAYDSCSLINGDAGTFVLMLDGKAVQTDSFGSINPLQTIRSTMNYSTTVTAGTHQIAVAMRRAYLSNSDPYAGCISPYQYLDNITLSGSSVPPRLNIQASGSTVVLTWTNAAFTLQAAPSPDGVYTNIPGAASPYTNVITETQKFFRVSK